MYARLCKMKNDTREAITGRAGEENIQGVLYIPYTQQLLHEEWKSKETKKRDVKIDAYESRIGHERIKCSAEDINDDNRSG